MKIRIIGTDDELEQASIVICEHFKPYRISDRLQSRDEDDEKIIYFDIKSEKQIINGNLQDFQVIGYCSKVRSKSDVSKYFDISFEAAGEILERLVGSQALYKEVSHMKYVYLDAEKCHKFPKTCKYCAHCGSWGQCLIPEHRMANDATCANFDYSPRACSE